MKTISLRSMRTADLEKVVEIHLKCFPGFFLSFLGPRFLKLYYKAILDFSQYAFVAERAGSVAGFVTGIDNGFGFFRVILKTRGLQFAIAAVPTVLRKPTIIPRLLRAFKKGNSSSADGSPSVTLTFIAVDQAQQGTGTGQQLMQHFESIVRNDGFKRIFLETNADNNEAVCRFYERRGYSIVRTYVTSEGRRMHEYAKNT